MSELLSSLLLLINRKLEESENGSGKLELAGLISDTLEADGCAIYLYEAEAADFLLSGQYSFLRELHYADAWQRYSHTPFDHIEYFDNFEQADKHNLKSGLILPLRSEHEIAGVVLIGWQSASPIQPLSREDYQILQIIAHLLSNVYCVYPLVSRLRNRERDLAALYQKAEQDLEDSRKRVSLELHDEVGQVLTSILLQLKLLQQSENLEYIRGRLGGLYHITQETLGEVRRISQNLRPNILEKLGLYAAVEIYIKDYMENTGIEAELRTSNLDRRVPEELETIIYRAVQEGLTNAARHSGAGKVTVSLTIKGPNLFLQISDNGTGMAEDAELGTGLSGMRERVTRAGGRFWLLHGGVQGLTVNILLPLQDDL